MGWVLLAWLVCAVVVSKQIGFEPAKVAEGMKNLVAYAARFTRPDFGDFGGLLGRMGETLVMAVWGSALACLIAIPLSWFASNEFSPSRGVVAVTREVCMVLQALPDLLWALLFLQALGVGPLPGVLALGVHSAGFLSRTLADSLDRLPRANWEGVQACGASRLQLVRFAGWPSIGREWVGFSLYTLDRNVRTAMILGVVGAGGIGVDLKSSFGVFDYSRASAILILIAVVVLATDVLAGQLRRRQA
ncbi:MAG: phosphonate ABC transporter, permease protein PhnE [Fimbriimonas sp.]